MFYQHSYSLYIPSFGGWVGSAGDQTQDLAYAKQGLYHWATRPSPILCISGRTPSSSNKIPQVYTMSYTEG